MRWSFDMDRKVFIFTRSRQSPLQLQGGFRWSFPRPEGLGSLDIFQAGSRVPEGPNDRSLARSAWKGIPQEIRPVGYGVTGVTATGWWPTRVCTHSFAIVDSQF